MIAITWLSLGVFNWVALSFYRVWTDAWPWHEPLMSYVRGFVGALACGPLCPLVAYLIDRGNLAELRIRDCNDISEYT